MVAMASSARLFLAPVLLLALLCVAGAADTAFILVHKTASLQRVKDVERVKVGITLQNAGSRLVVRIFHVLEVNNLCSFHMCFGSCFGLFPTCCVMCTNVYYTTGGFGENSIHAIRCCYSDAFCLDAFSIA